MNAGSGRTVGVRSTESPASGLRHRSDHPTESSSPQGGRPQGVSHTEPARCSPWPVTTALLGAALLIFLTSSPGWFVSDNRFIQFWNPARALDLATTAWSAQVNLGAVQGPPSLIIQGWNAILDVFGAPPWLIQRLLHALIVGGGAVGASLVTREFLPRARAAHLLTGLFWIASPYTIAFLRPSALYVNVAVAPWLVLALLRGTASPSRWRWAAVFTLAIALAGFTNVPGLVLASLPLIPVAVYLVATRRTSASDLVAWLGRAAILVTAVLLFDVHRAALISGYIGQNLESSETAEAVSRSSSWSESLRGLGFWLSYWNPRGDLLQPWLRSYFTSIPLVLATFVAPVVAVGAAAFSRFRGRYLFGSVLLLSTAVMVGGFPLDDQSPYGRALFALFDSVPATFAFRNSYKAGAGWLLATAVLLAMGVTALWTRAAGRRWRRALIAGATATILVATSAPLWTGSVYELPTRTSALPSYWHEATEWLNDADGHTRALIVPGTVENYRWGAAPQGDLFSSLLERPFILNSPLTRGSRDTANLIAALDRELSLGQYRPGSLAPIARRIGVEYVVVRNDLRWESTDIARPAALDTLRNDPALERVATFGERGQNVVAGGDSSPDAIREARLPPVEIYRLDGAVDPVRAVTGPALLVSGDGAAWPSLAVDGTLDDLGPVRYTGRIQSDEALAELRSGAAVVMTDTNRRRTSRVGIAPGETLRADSGRRAVDLFERPGSQSVATFSDAESIEYIGPPVLAPAGAASRPAAAFDADPATAFVTGGLNKLGDPDGLRVRLRQPATISSITIDASGSEGRTVSRAELVVPDGTPIPIDLTDGHGTVVFEAKTVDEFEVRVTELAGDGDALRDRTPWLIRDITVTGVALAEVIQIPDDLIRAADASPELASALASAPLSYRFERLETLGTDVETTLRRAFRVSADRTFVGAGTAKYTGRGADGSRLDRWTRSADGELPDTCHHDLLTIDGAPVPVRLSGATAAFLDGAPVEMTLCGAIRLDAGWHQIVSDVAVPPSVFKLTASDGRPHAGATPQPLGVTNRGDTHTEIVLDSATETRVILGQAGNDGWTATADGTELGTRIDLDTQSAWVVPAGSKSVEATFGPQTTSTSLLVLFAGGVIACLALVLWNPTAGRSRSETAVRGSLLRDDHSWGALRRLVSRPAAPYLLAVAFAVLVAGLPGGVIAAAASLAVRRNWLQPRVLGGAAVAYVIVAALLTIPPLGPDLTPVTPAWPLERGWAHTAASIAAVLLGVVMAAAMDARKTDAKTI